MSSFAELDETVAFLKAHNCEFSIMQCTTSYPTKPEQFGLNVIKELKGRYNVPVGFSDHSAKIETCIAATAMGAEMLEFHVVFDRGIFGPDSTSSLIMSEVTQLNEAVRNIETALNNPIDKSDNSAFTDLKSIFEKSLAINKDLSKDHVITFSDLEAKKPKGFGISANAFKNVIGKSLKGDMKQWDFLNEDDLI